MRCDERVPRGRAGCTEDVFRYSRLALSTPTVIRQLAELYPATLALMHGSSYRGDCAAQLDALAQEYERRISGAP